MMLPPQCLTTGARLRLAMQRHVPQYACEQYLRQSMARLRLQAGLDDAASEVVQVLSILYASAVIANKLP